MLLVQVYALANVAQALHTKFRYICTLFNSKCAACTLHLYVEREKIQSIWISRGFSLIFSIFLCISGYFNLNGYIWVVLNRKPLLYMTNGTDPVLVPRDLYHFKKSLLWGDHILTCIDTHGTYASTDAANWTMHWYCNFYTGCISRPFSIGPFHAQGVKGWK